MKTRGYELEDAGRTEEGHLILKVKDFLRDKEETIVVVSEDADKIREMLMTSDD